MNIYLKLNTIALILAIYSGVVRSCVNRFEGKQVRASGDWSFPIWNGAEPNGLLKFDPASCLYTLVIGGLKPNTQFAWKITINNAWAENYGCSGLNGPNCVFKTNADGVIRLKAKPDVNPPQLTSDYEYTSVDVVLKCPNKFTGKNVRAVGEWNNWVVVDPQNLMTFDESTCNYVLSVGGLKPSFNYLWKVAVGDSWIESYGCNKVDCKSTTNADGSVRYVFKPNTNELATDYNLDSVVTPSVIATTSSSSITQSTLAVINNPVKPCTGICPSCTNNFASKLIRATGDWTKDAGSTVLWDGAEPLGLMTFEEKFCLYTLVITGLKKNFQYKWKATINNSFKENYGCTGLAAADCSFKSNSAGAVRLLFKPSTNPPQLTFDYNVAECGDNVCEPGETCGFCPADCGECPPPVCGDDICEETENFMSCPADCPNELPGCERFNDESCKSGSQISANPGVEKRRWQTPKPGQKNYQASYQHYYALVGYSDIRYISAARTEADVCIVAIHKDSVTLTYHFNDEPQSNNCKRFSSSHKSNVQLKVTGSDGTSLVIAPAELYWNRKPLASRPGDFRNGQKGAVPEMFGWKHSDVEKECELLAKAGYLGVKLFPVHEQIISYQPFEDAMNPWYFMYQPVSYNLDGRMGTREELIRLVNTCRSHGVRVYVDVILNHFTGAGNDMHDHRNPNAGCTKWGNKSSSAPIDRQSPFYTHAYTYKYNPNSGEPPSNEFPGAAIGPEDFHCDRSLGSWSDLFILNNGWLVGLTDIDTSKDNVRERQSAYLVELLSIGVSGFRIDAAKHMSPDDISAVFKKLQAKMGGQLPEDFFSWLEVLTGGESGVLWSGPAWYGAAFEEKLRRDLGSQAEVDKIKMWDGLYPKEPQNNPISRKRVVIQNDDHDQQMPGSSSRDMGPFGCVLVKDCATNDHRNFEIKLFENPYGVGNNADEWPIRFILSSYYHSHGKLGIPDGLSDCSICSVTCASCKESIPYIPAYVPGECAYVGKGYTKVHRDIKIINAMRKWMNLGPISGGDIGLPGCN